MTGIVARVPKKRAPFRICPHCYHNYATHREWLFATTVVDTEFVELHYEGPRGRAMLCTVRKEVHLCGVCQAGKMYCQGSVENIRPAPRDVPIAAAPMRST